MTANTLPTARHGTAVRTAARSSPRAPSWRRAAARRLRRQRRRRA
ncbi:hypothetical protein NKH77_05590 [Streptomyces sp. M19]